MAEIFKKSLRYINRFEPKPCLFLPPANPRNLVRYFQESSGYGRWHSAQQLLLLQHWDLKTHSLEKTLDGDHPKYSLARRFVLIH